MSHETEFEKKKERHASGQSTVSTDSVSNYIPTPPDGGYGWVIVMAAFFIHVIVDGVTFTFGVFYVAFLDYFEEGKGKTSLVGSLLGGFYLMICFVASGLVNKFGCRPVSVVGSLLSSLAFFLSIFSPNVDVLMLTYGVLGGSGFALTFFPSVISVSFYFQRRRALATGIAVCGAGVGGFIMAPFGRYLLDVYDWKNAMLIVSGICLNGCVFACLLRPLEPPKKKRRPRTKNVIDRLVERTKRRRQESECSTCAHHSDGKHSMMQRIQEVKLARENMLREEDSEFGSECGSVPNSTLNSVRKLDRSDSYTYGYVPSRSSSIQIPRQEVLRREAAGSYPTGSPTSLGTSPPYYGTSPSSQWPSPTYGGASSTAGTESASVVSSNVPVIVIACPRDDDPDEDTECSKILLEESHDDRPRSLVYDAVPEENEEELLSENATQNGLDTAVDKTLLFKNTNGHMNGSLPVGIHTVEKLESQDSVGYIVNVETGRRRHQSKSAGDINKMKSAEKKFHRPRGVQKTDYSRPLYRKDIFYSGSVLHVPHFKSQPDVQTYVKSMMSIPEEVSPDKESCFCKLLPKAAKDTMREMMDVTLFREPIFLVAAVGNLFAFIGLFIPFVFIADRALMYGLSDNEAAFLLSVIGITNMLGRLIAGFLADIKRVNSLLLHNVALLMAGVACVLNMLSTTYATMCVFAAVFGLCVATYISLTSIVLCNMLGVERLTNAYGLLCALRGFASIAGPPIAGAVLDATDNYDLSFHVGGAMMFVSGLVFSLLHLPYFQRQSWHNLQLQDPATIEVVFDDDLAAKYTAETGLSNLIPTPSSSDTANVILVRSCPDTANIDLASDSPDTTNADLAPGSPDTANLVLTPGIPATDM